MRPNRLAEARRLTRPRRLLLLGTVLVDIVVDTPALPARGGDILGTSSYLGAGGGYTVLTAAARLGLPAAYAGAHGSGLLGERVRADLAAAGIETLLPPTPDGDTGYCVVLVEPGGERTFVTAPGVEAAVRADQLAIVDVHADDAVYLSGYDLAYPGNGPLLADFVSRLPTGPLVVVDPGPLAGQLPVDRWGAIAARADIVSLTAGEASYVGPRPGGPTRPSYVVRRGSAGATVNVDGVGTDVPGRPLPAVDSTGAGDVHVGAMLAALAAGEDLVAAVATANLAAAFSVLRRGPATGPTAAELAAFAGRR